MRRKEKEEIEEEAGRSVSFERAIGREKNRGRGRVFGKRSENLQ